MELGEGQVSLFSDQRRQTVFALYNCRKCQNSFFLNSCNDRGNQFVSGFVISLWRKTDEHFHAWILYQ